MQSYYINLDRATERRELIEAQIKKADLNFTIERFPAINGSDFEWNDSSLSKGQWGCWQSHLAIIERSLANNEDLLIIEDDEYFSNELNKIIDIRKIAGNTDWDIIYLDATIVEVEDYLLFSRSYYKNINNELYILKVPPTSTIYGTHAYLINGKKKQKFFDILSKNFQTGLPIDNVFAAAIQEKRVSALFTLPFLCSPGKETSNSQINHGQHPLSKEWINYREFFSINNPDRKKQEFINLLNQITFDSIIARMKLSIIEVFSPYIGKINKLN